MPAPPRIWRPCGRGGAGRAARSSRATQLPARDVRRQGEVRMRSIRMGLGAKSTGNGKPVRTRVKRKRSAWVSSRIKSAK